MSTPKKLYITMSRQEALLGWIFLFAQQLLLKPSLLQIGDLLLSSRFSEAELNFIYFSINLLGIIGIFHRFLGNSWRMMRRQMGYVLQSAFLGYAVYRLGTILISWLILLSAPDFVNINDSTIAAMAQQEYAMMAVGTVFFVPIVEETLYRGLLFQGLYNRSRISAYLVSTLAFSAIHVVNYIGSYPPKLLALCFLQYIPAGLSLAWAYARSNTIFAPILIHMTVNAIGIAAIR